MGIWGGNVSPQRHRPKMLCPKRPGSKIPGPKTSPQPPSPAPRVLVRLLEAGNVLRDLIDSGAVSCFRLSKVFRQAASSAIIRFARQTALVQLLRET